MLVNPLAAIVQQARHAVVDGQLPRAATCHRRRRFGSLFPLGIRPGDAGARAVGLQPRGAADRRGSLVVRRRRGRGRVRRQAPAPRPPGTPRGDRSALPRVVLRRAAPPPRRAARAARRSPSTRRSRRVTDSTVGSGIRQFSPSQAEVAVAVGVGADDGAPVAIASSGGRQKPSCVDVCTNTVAWLNSSLTPSSLGARRRSVAPCSGAELGLDPEERTARVAARAAPATRRA